LPQVTAILVGVKAVIIAVVVQALWNLARSAVKSIGLGVLAAAAIGASILGVHELAVLFGGGGAAMLARWAASRRQPTPSLLIPLGTLHWGNLRNLGLFGAGATSFGLAPLFFVFLKVGAVLFGSGYVLLAYLRADLVERLHWLTNGQLIDAIAVGQVTPGPVFTTATFVGYVLGGFSGGAVATVGIFLPAFVFVALSAPIVPRLRRSLLAGGFLDGVNVASLALMAVVTWFLARSAIVSYPTLALALASAILLIRFRVNSVWLVLAGGLFGFLSSLF
jgi:chromate transporter